jgi:hypothetical protein
MTGVCPRCVPVFLKVLKEAIAPMIAEALSAAHKMPANRGEVTDLPPTDNPRKECKRAEPLRLY